MKDCSSIESKVTAALSHCAEMQSLSVGGGASGDLLRRAWRPAAVARRPSAAASVCAAAPPPRRPAPPRARPATAPQRIAYRELPRATGRYDQILQ